MWGHYHKCRTSDTFKQNWEKFLEKATSRPSCPIMYQNLTCRCPVIINWSMVAADWEEEEAQALLELVVDLWITIRGFSFASAWIEAFKAEHKKSVQKSKGVRKQLCTATSSNV